MKVAYVIPTHFDQSSVIAGAERYAYGLAKAASEKVETSLITFSDCYRLRQDGNLTIHYFKSLFYVGGIVNPFSVTFLKALADATVIHCLQFRTIVTDLAILYGALTGKRIFVTDLSGQVKYTLSYCLPVWRGVHAFLLISEYNRRLQANLPVTTHIINGGVDPNLFSPGIVHNKKGCLYVGRIYGDKGIHDLIEALPREAALDVVGRSHDDKYLALLKKLRVGKAVVFSHGTSDTDLIAKYRNALATVLPSLVDGGFTTAMESMACGTLVIGTRVGSLPEIIEDGVTGFLVPPNDPAALRERIEYVMRHPVEAREMGMRGREVIMKRFTWDAVAMRCLELYGLEQTRHDRFSVQG